MNLPLLQTKFQPVLLGDTVLSRPHLLAQLDAGLSSTVTLVSAPAGYGKSTLISSWIEHIADRAPVADDKRLLACWLSLDEADNHLPTFLLYLIAAIEEGLPNCCAEVRQLVQARPTPSIETLAGMLVNCLSRQDESILLVLDDLHLIRENAVFVFLARLIEYAPPQLHLVLISRVDPPLPLNRWRATRRLREVRLHDLSFSPEETTAFFRINLDSMPPNSLIEMIRQRTEGWIVGSWLALLALRGQADPAELARHIQGQANRYTVDYLVEEVLSQQPPAAQKFLVCTAILDRFSPALCAALLDIDIEAASAQIDYLFRANLFVIDLGTSGSWYRYHHQFQEMLLSRLPVRFDSGTITELHRRAAAWLVDHQLIGEGLSHLIAIPDYDAVAELIARQRVYVLNELLFSELEAWLNLIPLSLLNQRADLLIGMAWVKRDHVDNEPCLALLRQAANLIESEPAALSERNRQLLAAEFNALHVSVDKSLTPEAALSLIRQSWAILRQDLSLTHCSVILSLAYRSQELGELNLAKKIVQTTLDEAADWPMLARCRIAHAAGFFHFCGGESVEAEQRFQHNLRMAQMHDLPIISVVSRHGLGAIADARNELEQAVEHHSEVIKQAHLTSGRDAAVDMYSLIGLNARRRDQEKSRALVAGLVESAKQTGTPFFLAQVAALEAYVDLTCGELKRALRWALSMPHREMKTTSDRIPQIRARILLADGSEACLLEADQILRGLVEYYANGHVWYRQTEIFVLQALVLDGLDRSDSALALLASAVELAVPKGGVGLLMGYGEAIARMLGKLEKQPRLSQSVALLLTALATEDVAPKYAAPAYKLPEALTERELAVLQLLAARYSNKEIAGSLVVSPHTVRNHTANIYGKLQVTNRREAVQRAQTLGLLSATASHQQ